MFRKIVTELAYSPALAGNLGYYIKQLRNETSKRQIGLIFIFLAVTVQLFATLFPPESANANNPAVFIDGGIASKDEYLTYYDQNTGNIKDLLNSLGIKRSEIASAKFENSPALETAFAWSFQSTREDENAVHLFTTSNNSPGVAHYQSVSSQAVATPAYVGSSSRFGGKFAITQNGASLITEKKPASLCAAWLSSPKTPLRVDSWFKSYDESCRSKLDTTLTAREISSTSQNIGTIGTSERIAYTASMRNTTDDAISISPSINLEDVLEYARILDYGGGEYDFDTKNLTWPTTPIKAGATIQRTLIVQLLPTIPATAMGQHVPRSYNCEITLTFGDTLSYPIDCPPTKYIEKMASVLPGFSSISNIVASIFLVITAAFLYARSKQLLTELYIIRHNHHGGL